ncbi:aspartic peptidase domain-containing protein [Suillus spraguei]|nr:aspartic peptidase domain-containing protein [Suillus spraguei]
MFSAPLLTLLLVLSITGSPVKAANSLTSVPITSRLNFSNDTYNLVAHDRARLQALMGHSKHGQRQVNVPLTNGLFVYTISVNIGVPPQAVNNLILDSGTANTWVGAGTPYQVTHTSVPTYQFVSVTYLANRHMDGLIYNDTVSVSPGLTVNEQAIGVVYRTLNFVGYDGVLGIGPVALTLNTLSLTPTKMIPTVTDNLVKQNIIPANILGVFFTPYTSLPEETGRLTFGGTDVNLHTDDITYVSTIKIPPVSHYWGIDQSISYGTRLILPYTTGIVDSGQTIIGIATEAFQLYRDATGGQLDPATGLLIITGDQHRALQNLNFNIDNKIFALTPNAQIWPRALNYKIGGQQGSIYLIVGDIGVRFNKGPWRTHLDSIAPPTIVGTSSPKNTNLFPNQNPRTRNIRDADEMSTKEISTAPAIFNGDTRTAQGWSLQMDAYMSMNDGIYNNDKRKAKDPYAMDIDRAELDDEDEGEKWVKKTYLTLQEREHRCKVMTNTRKVVKESSDDDYKEFLEWKAFKACQMKKKAPKKEESSDEEDFA